MAVLTYQDLIVWQRNEFAYHLRVSQGSIQEAETQVMIAERLSFAERGDLHRLLQRADEVGKLNRGLHLSIRAS